jgi:hypothetical protein
MIVRITLSSDVMTPTFNFRGVVNELYQGSLKTDITKSESDWYRDMYMNRTALIGDVLLEKFRIDFLDPALNKYLTDKIIKLYDPFD